MHCKEVVVILFYVTGYHCNSMTSENTLPFSFKSLIYSVTEKKLSDFHLYCEIVTSMTKTVTEYRKILTKMAQGVEMSLTPINRTF